MKRTVLFLAAFFLLASIAAAIGSAEPVTSGTPKDQAAADQGLVPVPAAPPALKSEAKSGPEVKIKVRLQPRFSVVETDANQPYFGASDDQAEGGGFSLRRMRLYVVAQVDPKTRYILHLKSDAGEDKLDMRVGEVQLDLGSGREVRAGQFVVPVGYEIVAWDGDLLVVDRHTVSLFLPPDADIGVVFSQQLAGKSNLTYHLGACNGNGRFTGNVGGKYLLLLRAEAKPTPGLSVGTSWCDNQNTNWSPYFGRFIKKNGDPYGLTAAYDAHQVDERSFGADAQYQRGPLTVWAEWMGTKISPVGAPPIYAEGFYVDAAHFLPYRGRSDQLEAVIGWQGINPNTSVRDKYDMRAYTVGLNWHFRPNYEQILRLNYMWVDEARNDVKNDKLIVQYQLWL